MTTLAIPDHSMVPALRIPTRQHVLDAIAAGMNPNTRRAYAKGIRDFAAYLATEDPYLAVDTLLGLSRGDANGLVLGYRASMLDKGLSSSTVGLRLAAVRKVVQFARILGDVDWELEVASPRSEPYRDTRGPGAVGWKSMLNEVRRRADEGDVKAIRNLAIVRLLHDLGLRRGEVCALDHESLDQERGTVAVVGKGKRQAEELTLPEPTIQALADWLAVRGDHPGPLFTRLDNAGSGTGRLTGQSVWAIVLELGVGAGLERRVRPHGLRHQAITTLLDRTGGDVRSVRKFSRHAKLDTLIIYDDRRTDVAGTMARLVAED